MEPFKTVLDNVYRQAYLKYQLLPTKSLNYFSLHNTRQFSFTTYVKFGNYHEWNPLLHSWESKVFKNGKIEMNLLRFLSRKWP